MHSERLRDVMDGLDRLQGQRLPAELDASAERALRRGEIATLARALADAASRIPQAPRGASLDASAEGEFLGLAETLQRQALALAAGVDLLPPRALRQQLAVIDETCRACHDRFRSQRQLRDP